MLQKNDPFVVRAAALDHPLRRKKREIERIETCYELFGVKFPEPDRRIDVTHLVAVGGVLVELSLSLRPARREDSHRDHVHDSTALLRHLPLPVALHGGLGRLLLLVSLPLQILEADHGMIVKHSFGEVLPALVLHFDVESEPDVAPFLHRDLGEKVGLLPRAAHERLKIFHLFVEELRPARAVDLRGQFGENGVEHVVEVPHHNRLPHGITVDRLFLLRGRRGYATARRVRRCFRRGFFRAQATLRPVLGLRRENHLFIASFGALGRSFSLPPCDNLQASSRMMPLAGGLPLLLDSVRFVFHEYYTKRGGLLQSQRLASYLHSFHKPPSMHAS